MVVPMLLDDCIKSQIMTVRLFGIDILTEIIKSSKSQNIAEKLKIKNKYERQLAFNHNSQQKIKDILNVHMDRIIVEMVTNAHTLNKAVEMINMLEMLAQQYGWFRKKREE